MAKKKYYQGGDYGNYDERRRQEREDSMMLSEDRSSIANMPQNVKYVQYPQSPYYNQPDLNDTIRGVDAQMGADSYSKSLKKNAYTDLEKY